METLNRRLPAILRKTLLTILSSFVTLFVFAQDATKNVDVNINSDSSTKGFLNSPFIWVIGAGVLILLLVALLRGNSRRSV